jgi:hypothetical protein
VEDEDEDEDEDPAAEAHHEGQHVSLQYRRPYSLTGTISRGGSRETVGLFVTANRYE